MSKWFAIVISYMLEELQGYMINLQQKQWLSL